MKCTCGTSRCWVPCASHPKFGSETGRHWVICAACGEWWHETDGSVVARVQAEHEEWELREALTQSEYREHRTCGGEHRLIALRNGKQVCRDCGQEVAT